MEASSHFPRKHSTFLRSYTFAIATTFLFSGLATAAPSITLSKRSGPPTSQILVSGRGFEPNVGVDIYFDTKDEALVITNGQGEFNDARVHAPRSVRPGQHWVTALERNNDKGAQEPFLVQTNWTQFHFDAEGTRVNPYENVLNPRNVNGMDLKWSFTTGSHVSSPPVVSGGVVYVGSDDHHLYALNARTGAQFWSFATGDIVTASPVVADGVVYLASWDSHIYAIEAVTGAELWAFSTGTLVSASPLVENGIVYVGAEGTNGGFWALDAHTGSVVWSLSGIDVEQSAAVANGVVYFGRLGVSYIVYALNAETGAIVWTAGINGGMQSSPSVRDGVLFFGGGVDDVLALNADNGASLWRYQTRNGVVSTPAVTDTMVYAGSLDYNVYALDAATGAQVWSYATNGEVGSSPAVANGVVYIGSADGNLYALDAKAGSSLWKYPTGAIYSSPTVADGTVYVGSSDDNIYAFSLKHGSERASNEVPPDLGSLRPDLTLEVSNRLATVSRH